MDVFLLAFAAASAAVLGVHIALAVGLTVNLVRDRRRRVSPQGESRLSAEVIVAVRNEEENLPRLLGSLRAQTRTDCLFLLVDDRSTDATPRILEEFCSEIGPRARVLRNSKNPEGLTGKQTALDLAFGAAKGDVLLFTDGDCVMSPSWVECMLGCFRDPRVGVALARIELRAEGGFLERFQAFEQPLINQYNFGAAGLGVPMGGFGNNMAVRREAVNALGGFRALGYSVTEDAMLLDAICRAGSKNPLKPRGATNPRQRRGAWKVRVAVTEGAVAVTRPKQSWADFVNQHTRWNAGALFSEDLVTRVSYILVVLVYLTASLLLIPFGFLDWRIPILSLTSFASIGLLGVFGGFYAGKDRGRYFARFLPYLFFFAFFYAFVTVRAFVKRPFEWKGVVLRSRRTIRKKNR
jgi:cellulose synthase/poly-beta-1,6-N-acetylglucosamine synthase-like glycosyltransferase